MGKCSTTHRMKSDHIRSFWSVFSHIWTEYAEIRSISPYSVEIRENTVQKNSALGYFSRSDCQVLNEKMIFKSTNIKINL